jgi:RimJ/RimL family protein N-acetyltransferase
MTRLATPTEPLTDGMVTLRLPAVDTGDIDAVISYIEEEQLDGGWLPEIPLVSAEQAVRDWLEAWAGRPSRNGPTLVVTIPDEQRFIGIVGFGDRGEGVVEMIYGITPRWRGRGLASRAVRRGALWALSQPGVITVELRIDQDMRVCQHVAVNAGFVVAGTVSQIVPGTGETFEDLRYVLSQPSATAKS